MKSACWNVQTLFDNELTERPHCKTALLAQELSLYNINIVGLSETHFADDGQFTKTTFGYTFFWKGSPANETRELGVGFIIKTSLVKKTYRNFFSMNQNILFLYVYLCNTIMSVYVPTMSFSESDILSMQI